MSVEGLATSFLKIMKATEVSANCMARKQSWKLISHKSQSRTKSLLELIHIDLCGPFSIPSLFKSKRVRCKLLENGLPKILWTKIVNITNYMVN
jgi:hypothetical protein